MNKPNRGLGRGLSALFSDTEEAYENAAKSYPAEEAMPLPEDIKGLTEVDIDDIRPNPNQPRKHFDEDALNELADSIKKHGLIMPIVVNQPENGKYMIIAGERRYRAAKIAGKRQIPVVVRSYTDREIKEISLIENLQREDLNPIEAANAMKQLMDEYHLTQEELAERIGKSRPAVANTLRLLTLVPEVVGLVESGKLSAGHARALVSVPAEKQYAFAEEVVRRGYSVRETERAVKSFLTPPEVLRAEKAAALAAKSEELKAFVERMRAALHMKVSLIGNDKKGRIYIDYYNTDDLNALLELLEQFPNQRKGGDSL